MKAILMFNHVLTQDQIEDLTNNWAVDEILYMPVELKNEFSNLDPNEPDIDKLAEPFENWLASVGKVGDLVVIQGDPGVVVKLVNTTKSLNMVPIYATTKRVAVEQPQADGTVIVSKVFKHCIFRMY